MTEVKPSPTGVVQGPLRARPCLSYGVEGRFREHLPQGLKRRDAGVLLGPLERRLGRFEHTKCGSRYFRADSIARDENDLMRCHFMLPAQE